jgi:Tfp pilus assembly protein PilZ
MRIAGIQRSREVTEGLNTVIEAALREFTRRQKTRNVFVSEFKQGECTIVIPKVEEESVSMLCGLFRRRVNGYLRFLGIRDCFINVGVLEFLYRDSRRTARSQGASIYVKKIFIGAEKRRCRRVSYHMRVEPIVRDTSLGQTYSLDISRHGICFISNAPLAANARLTINLALPRAAHPLPLTGRVAWIRPETGDQSGKPRYKIGVEFVNVTPARQRELNRFVEALTRVKACPSA